MTGKYEQLGTEIGKLVDVKNADYGSSFSESHKILEVLYPNGISLEQMKDALFITRVVDKLFRIATNKNVLAESAALDIAGYAILQAMRDRQEKIGAIAENLLKKQVQALGKLKPVAPIGSIVEEVATSSQSGEILQYSREVDENGENVPYIAEEDPQTL